MLDTPENQQQCLQEARTEVANTFDDLANVFGRRSHALEKQATIETYYNNQRTANKLIREASTNDTLSARCRRLAQGLHRLVLG